MAKTKAPILIVELIEQGKSGWVQEGTERTNNPVELRAPQLRNIPNTGYRKKEVVLEDGTKTFMNEHIRYIKNQPIISVEEQEKRGIRPNHDRREDWIPFKAGRLSVTREGALIGLYEYINDVYYNESNLNRVEEATAIYRVIKVDEDAAVENDTEENKIRAGQYILALREKTGKDGIRYNESKIDAICNILGIHAESPSTKIRAMHAFANEYPDLFLKKVSSLEHTTVLDVSQGIQLNVIRFEGNTAVYVAKDKIIKGLGAGKMDNEQKINKLADFFKSKDGQELYEEFKTELNSAKEAELTK